MHTKVTDLAAWRAAHARPVSDACRWSETLQAVTEHNMRMLMIPLFVWPRMMLRAMMGA